jgi:Zn-dependent peptidase ImmA (M78 family)
MLNIPKLAALKPYWKVSMAALLKRAGDLYTISKRQAQYLWMKMGPYRKREPVSIDIPVEQPQLFKELLRMHREDLNYDDDEMADMLLFSKKNYEELIETFFGKKMPANKLRVIK